MGFFVPAAGTVDIADTPVKVKNIITVTPERVVRGD